MPKNLSARLLRIGIDARLAYRRGAGSYTANLIRALSQVDSRNEYFLFNAPPRLKAQVKNPRFHWMELSFFNAAYYEQVLLPRAARQQSLDFLHYVDNSGTTLSGFPFVLTLHDTMHTRSLSLVRPQSSLRHRFVYAYKKWAIPKSAQKAKALITVSEYSKRQIVEGMGMEDKRVSVTPNGVDSREFKEVSRKPSKIFKVLVHGAADERKNITNVLKAARLLADEGRNFQMNIIGMDEAELKCTRYPQEAAEMGLGRYVEWRGKVPDEKMRQTYTEADLLLYPSRWEGFGLPVLEAFACGVPVVTSNTTSLPEVAGNAALLVDPENPRAIAKAVRQLMERPTLRKLLVQRGMKRVKLFTWEKTARLTLKVYERMKGE